MTEGYKRCPYCDEEIRVNAIKCKHCGSFLTEPVSAGAIRQTAIREALMARYDVLEEIGRGGMGIVYKAIPKKLNRPVALKVLPPQFTPDEKFLRRFHGEARKAAQLNHPSIITIYDEGVESGVHLLSHHYQMAKCSPEELYLQLLALAGQIMTSPTGFDIRPSDFARFDHNHLANCFNTLIFQIREQLDKIVPSVNYANGKLEKSGENLWYGSGISEQLLQTAQFYLIASGDTDERKLIDEFPRKLKIAPRETIHALAMAAINGLKVAYTPRPPAGMPGGTGVHHFHLEKTGDFWEAICRSLGILVPAEFMKLKLELIALKPE